MAQPNFHLKLVALVKNNKCIPDKAVQPNGFAVKLVPNYTYALNLFKSGNPKPYLKIA